MSLGARMLCTTVVVLLAQFGAGPPLLAAQRSSPEQRILELTNAARARVGCPALRPNAELSRAAAAHSADMAHRNFFAHTGSDGQVPAARTRSAGYPGSYIGENIAAGNKTAEGTFRQWMRTAPHRSNVLNCAFTDLGVGHAVTDHSYYRHYWTQALGRL
ncbi:CAP domain-containing protein [Saccharopolyspora sp. K220]|uniref:CAP domain-containing protein n=1 Tax=Saccharopolyspora soli TaxID=2926618 RepID=UPI001F55D43A|nr:CAP domain-containing protein [Saccharopolyspora soli]MCI2417741.1 CAP domain-containing protein [Saccharopolyspora soli]